MAEDNTGLLPPMFEAAASVVDGTQSDQGAGGPLSSRRGLRRVSAACQRCRRRKQKCDGKRPVCGTCAAANLPCVPPDRLVVRMDRDCECDHLRSQVESLNSRVHELRSQLASYQRQAGADLWTSRPEATARSTTGHAYQSESNGSLDRLHRGRMLLPTFRESSVRDNPDIGFMSSSWHLWNGLSATDTTQATPATFSLRDDGPGLVDVFFDRRWPQYPVLHRPTFMEQHYLPFTRGHARDRLSSFQVNIVLAIGASEKARTSHSASISYQGFFEAAVQDLDTVLAADDIDCIQCLLLLCIFGSNEPQSVNLWYTAGLALRLMVGIDLHRHEALANTTLLDAEMCKRLFWSLYAMDRSISISLGRPLSIQDADITIPPPLLLSDDKLAGPPEQAVADICPNTRDMSAFRHNIELRRINADIYKALHSAGDVNIESSNLESIRRQHYARLNTWLLSAPRYLAPISMYQTSEWFQIAYHQAVINLHRPCHASPVSSADSIRLCADSSISLISCYNALYAKNKIVYTFVALDSLFMAAVTMLYSIRASAPLRHELTRQVVESNIETCIGLLSKISHGRMVGERSTQVIRRLGNAILAVFDTASPAESEVDTEFMSWFGVKCQNPPGPEYPTPSIDTAWNDLFEHGYDPNGFYNGDLFF
ncbi:hypothetical protein FZEAL_8526 [Fusarium zealandicum]|uniref:Zn(2)-C6 fungal-type domain-containing protein n=1 Tax=Fusarium zealandicum TaxID=1053134 RepID=A0A8H4UDP5_9HYPO|nr:hypothetical protein FZEAL_8526 [Fusarium zealandicum]